MQRRLVLIRHAAAAQAPVDADRPLTDQGTAQAAAIGRWLQQRALRPERVVVSPARRARQTWDAAAAQLPTPPEATLDERIYDNTVEALFAVLHGIPEDC